MVCHIPSYYQRADVLTKPLSTKNFMRLKEELRVSDNDRMKKTGKTQFCLRGANVGFTLEPHLIP